ncbi:terminase small subunit [Amedibacterium intestinale]|uniref:terminase small subunit n=1 Tax=Amedibacterium intestinale TaxID=2583452 RepID=UPI001373CC74|nr:terminase small subunit [Amedibacterium intestinale]BBK61863.1 terminase small subunit [Amedibacterium intestinale]
MNVTKMTNKQKRFCDEYLIDLNATQSAIRAGYSPKTARFIGQENLTKPNIKAYIEERMAEKEKELIASQDEVLRYLTSVMRGQSESEIVVVEGCGDGVSQAVKVKKAPDERERLKAGELLAKRYGILSDKVNIEGAIPVVISGSDDLED